MQAPLGLVICMIDSKPPRGATPKPFRVAINLTNLYSPKGAHLIRPGAQHQVSGVGGDSSYYLIISQINFGISVLSKLTEKDS